MAVEKRKRRSPEETRRLVLETAAAELARTGGNLEMATLARMAGLSEGLAFHYFGNRAGLIAAVVEAFYDRYEAAVIDLRFAGATWQEREKQRVRALVEFYFEEDLTPVILTRLGSEPQVADVEARRSRRQIELAARNISRAQAAGDIPSDRDPEILGAMMLGALRWGVATLWNAKRQLPLDAVFAEIWAVIDAMSRAGQATRGRQ
jgi:AcrR family transcriptional regulator